MTDHHRGFDAGDAHFSRPLTIDDGRSPQKTAVATSIIVQRGRDGHAL